MTIHVVVQSKPDELRPCRWKLPIADADWEHGFFHLFFSGDRGMAVGVVLETSGGKVFTMQPVTSLELQFTDREETEGDVSGPMPCCPWQIAF